MHKKTLINTLLLLSATASLSGCASLFIDVACVGNEGSMFCPSPDRAKKLGEAYSGEVLNTRKPMENTPQIYASPPVRHSDLEGSYRFERYVLTPKSTWGHKEAERFLTDLNNSQPLNIDWKSSSTLSVAAVDGTKVKCNRVNATRQAVGDNFFLENYGVTLDELNLVSYKASAKPNLSLTTTDCHALGFERFINAYGKWNVVLPVNDVLFIGVPH